MTRQILVGLLLLSAACSSEDTIVSFEVDAACRDAAYAEVVVLDVWGRPLPATQISGDGPSGPALLDGALQYSIGATDLVTSSITIEWDGSVAAEGLTTSATGGALSTSSFDLAAVDGKRCHLYTVYLGLDHPFYARTGRAPKAGNKATLLMNGQEYWQSVYDDFKTAGKETRIHQSTWWWQSNFELIREAGHELMTETERRPNTMIALLEAQTAPVRLLVARFAADTAAGLAYLNTDPELRVHGTDPNDNFEVMLQANPTPAPLLGVYDATPITVDFGARVRANPAFAERTFAEDAGVIEAALETFDGSSYHQKCLTVGDSIAYISGMNVKSTDWDTAEHLVFDHRRMVFDATAEERAAVVARTALPDKGPRKDYGIRIEGPAARDVDDVMRVRWDLGIATSAMFEGDATAYDLLDPGAVKGTTTVQVVATMPDPVAERSILESQAKAVSQATDLIYIEDQYFRAPVLDVVIADAMERNPNLALIVVTKPIALTDGGKKWTVISDNIFRSRFPDRYLLLQLKNFDREDGEVYVQALDVHSKIITVDDVYLSTGSANKNNRGMLYEGELNAAVHSQAFVAPARQRILANLVGSDYAASLDGATGKQILELMRTLSEENEAFVQAVLADPEKVGTPSGFVYPLEFSEEYLLEVGPDVF